MFKVVKKSTRSEARISELKTAHGKILGPFFMPIATKGAVKNLSPDELVEIGAQIVLSNTYHLMIAPTHQLIKQANGLHKFMNWNGPILTDSGGFQVYSLSRLRKIDEMGVTFSDPSSGKKYQLTPELSMDIQADLGVDIAMAFDEVIGFPASKEKVELAMERTHRWAQRCLARRKKTSRPRKLFGIIQGGIYRDLRDRSVNDLTKLPFDGFAVGGIAVGEPRSMMKKILGWVVPKLPIDKPRYLMGLGRPEEIVAAVKLGIDMFDCVIPTREARHGRLYVWNNENLNSSSFYKTINITNSKFANNHKPLPVRKLNKYSYAYLHHLFRTNETLGMRLATINNLLFYLDLMKLIRRQIKSGQL